MKRYIFLSLLVTILFAGIAYAALPSDIQDREFGKFQETPGGQIAVLVTTSGTAPSATSYFDAQRVVTTAGTAVPLTAATKAFSKCTVQALEANTGDIVIGASTVDETPATRRGTLLIPGNSYNFDTPGNLLYIYIDSEVNLDGVSYFCQS